MATKRRNSKQAKAHNLSLTAVALQDHIARSTGLLKDTSSRTNRPNHIERLYTAQPSLTLAQRLGLVERPAPLLSKSQWNNIKITSSERGDSYQPCPICHDEFRLKSQVLLSCSHTFHKSCLSAFERFSGKKHCPLCRHQSYQATIITSASSIYMEKAATIIQSVWRGYCVRKWYNSYRETHPPSHPALRKNYYMQKLSKVTDQFIESYSDTSDALDSFFDTIDNDVRISRQVMSKLDTQHSIIVQWDEVIQKAMVYNTSTCAVCLTELDTSHTNRQPSLDTSHTNRQPSLDTSHTNKRPLSILSCSHLFHTCCVSSLETYSQSNIHLCPICRTPYSRRNYT